MNRGDVVVVPFPFQDKLATKIRPAVVVQADIENRRLANTILAMVTGNLTDRGQATTVIVDPTTAGGAGSGLTGPSLVKCSNLATVRQHQIIRTLGQLPAATLQEVEIALKAALDLA